MKKIITLILALAVMASVLCGCGENLAKKDDVIKEIERVVPGAKFVSFEDQGDGSRSDALHAYTFQNGEFSFVFYNSLSVDMFTSENYYSTDYFRAISEFKKEDILKIANKYDIEFFKYFAGWKEEELEALKKKDNIICHIIGMDYVAAREGNYGGIDLEFYVDSYSQIEQIDGFLKELKQLLGKYIPEEGEMFCPNIKLKLRLNEQKIEAGKYMSDLVESTLVKVNNGYMHNYDTFAIWAKYKYSLLVKEGVIQDSLADVGSAKPEKIEKLYINGELYESEEYATNFIYNAEDGKYYALVLFGYETKGYKGDIIMQDTLPREIIEKYYPESDYKIYDIKDRVKKSTWKIGKDKFKANWENNDKNESFSLIPWEKIDIKNADVVFYKNNERMNVKTLKQIGDATIDEVRYIFVEDLAEIIGMTVDRIDTENGAVYLKTK